MDILRTILIVLGILLIAGIYLAEPVKRRWQQYQQRCGHQRDDPYADLDSDEALGLRGQDDLPDEWVGEAYITRRNDTLPSDDLDALKGLGKQHEAQTDDVTLRLDDAPLADNPTPSMHHQPKPGKDKPVAAASAVVEPEPIAEAAPEATHQPTSETAPVDEPLARQAEEVIVLTLMAPKGKAFRGPLLLKSLQDAGLQHGDMQIFHYIPQESGRALFSVANILEPGHFVLSEMVQMETPGIAIFMQLPAAIDGHLAWRQMHQRAEQIATALGGTLCDAKRQPLDDSGLRQLQELAARFSAA